MRRGLSTTAATDARARLAGDGCDPAPVEAREESRRRQTGSRQAAAAGAQAPDASEEINSARASARDDDEPDQAVLGGRETIQWHLV